MSNTVVEVLYNYDSTTERGHGVHVQAGEHFRLICDEDKYWWYVGKNLPSIDGFYLPKSYLRVVSNGHGEEEASARRSNGYANSVASGQSSSASSSPTPCNSALLQTKRVSSSIPLSLEQAGLTLDPLTISTVDRSRQPRDAHVKHGNFYGHNTAPCHAHSSSLDDHWTPNSMPSSLSQSTGKRCSSFINRLDGRGGGKQVGRSRSPIYANLHGDDDGLTAPVLTSTMEPIRALSNGWLEYANQVGRPFFFHPSSGLCSWKPPRSSNANVSPSFQVDTSSMLQSSADSSLAATGGLEYCSVPVVNSKLDNSEHCVRVSVQDFSELNRLLSTSQHQSSQRSRSSLTASVYNPCMSSSDGAFKLSTFVQPTRKVIKYGTLTRCKYMECGKRVKYSPLTPRLSLQRFGETEANIFRKHWFTCFVYLNSAHMIFYKDEKSSEKQGKQYAAPLGVCDLRGAKIKWLDEEKCRKKKIFQLELVDGTSYLFQAESEEEIVEWFETLGDIVVNLTHLGHSRTPVIERGFHKVSTRRVAPSVDQKVSSKDSKSSDLKERINISEPLNTSNATTNVEPCVPSKESILEKLVRFFRNRPSIEFLKEKGIYKPEPVFGSSLMEVCRREKNTVPKFVTVCTSLIEERGLETDGLYRMSGNLSQIQKIRCSVDQDKYNVLINESDIHVLTGALKLFFRELQEPLFPPHLTKDFMNAIKLQNAKLRFMAFKELVGRLPLPHHDTLNALLTHLLKVAEKSSKNRMQVHNLAIVFGPTLFNSSPKPESGNQRRKKAKKSNASNRCSSDVPEVVQSNSHLAFSMIMHGQTVEYMLREHGKLFRPPSSGAS